MRGKIKDNITMLNAGFRYNLNGVKWVYDRIIDINMRLNIRIYDNKSVQIRIIDDLYNDEYEYKDVPVSAQRKIIKEIKELQKLGIIER